MPASDTGSAVPGAMAAAPEHAPPVFLMCSTLPAAEEKDYTVAEICSAAERVTGFNRIIGGQRIGNLWRVYPRDIDARVALLTRGVTLRGVQVTPKDKNPFIVIDNKGEREIPATRLTIGNLPLSSSNEEISKYVSKLPSVNVRSSLMEERARDDSGKLTHWKTGRRFVYIDIPSQPLPKTLRMGSFSATLYHKEQKIVTCSKCLVTGHHASVFTEPVKCRQCLQSGHKAGDPVCNFTPPQPPPPPSAEKEYIAKDKQRALKQANIAFPSARESRQARPHGARAATDSVRSRSLTPAPLTKRTRSPSAQRSPRSAGQKNARVSAKEATCAPVKAVPDVEEKTTPPAKEKRKE